MTTGVGVGTSDVAARRRGSSVLPGTKQWPTGTINFALTIDFAKVWNFT